MATSNEPTLYSRPESAMRRDVIARLLYRLRLSRIGIEKDFRARDHAEQVPAHLPANLHDAMFKADRLLLATQRLAETSTRDDFFTALQDVLANVVGTEAFALFEATSDAGWSLAAHCGVADEWTADAMQTDAFETALLTRELVGGDGGSRSKSPALVVPMLLDGSVVAVLVIFEWLPQKRFCLGSESEQVVEMLHVHGGTMLRALTPRGSREA